MNNASAKTRARIDNDYLLNLAAGVGKSDVVAYFMSEGGNIHAFDEEPLRSACNGGFLGTVKLLLDVGADPGIWGGECLSQACRRGRPNSSCFIRRWTDFWGCRALGNSSNSAGYWDGS